MYVQVMFHPKNQKKDGFFKTVNLDFMLIDIIIITKSNKKIPVII